MIPTQSENRIDPKDVTEEMLAGYIHRFCARNATEYPFGNRINTYQCLKTIADYTPLAKEINVKIKWYLIKYISAYLEEHESNQLTTIIHQLRKHDSVWFGIYGLRINISSSYAVLVTKLMHIFLHQTPGISEDTIKSTKKLMGVDFAYHVLLISGKLPTSVPLNDKWYPGDVVPLKPND